MKLRLTDRAVAKLALPAGKTEIIIFDTDTPGFGFRLRQAGSKIWIYQYSRDGRTRRMSLGEFPTISATKARETVATLKARVKLGFDPQHEKQERQTHKETFGEAAAAYLKIKTTEIRQRSLMEAKRYLLEHARSLHNRPLINVTQAEIADLLSRLAEEKGTVSANRARASISALLNWAAKAGKVASNVAAFTTKRAEKSRDRVLSDQELAAIWHALPEGDFGNIVKLLILTAQRRAEISKLCWSEIDLANGLISLPAERCKIKRAHVVPLSQAARSILQAQPRMFGRDYVLGRSDGYSGWHRGKLALGACLTTMKPFTLHDIRRSAVTGMVELGVTPHVVEAVVNHLSGQTTVARIYNHASHLPERRKALELWADHVSRIVNASGRKAAA